MSDLHDQVHSYLVEIKIAGQKSASPKEIAAALDEEVVEVQKALDDLMKSDMAHFFWLGAGSNIHKHWSSK